VVPAVPDEPLLSDVPEEPYAPEVPDEPDVPDEPLVIPLLPDEPDESVPPVVELCATAMPVPNADMRAAINNFFMNSSIVKLQN
jgi:hypothetical protein